MNLKEIIELAQGNRTQNQYALSCGISTSMIGKIKNGKRNPGKWTLKLLALKAHNGVTFNDLMIAAGYLPEDSKNQVASLDINLSPKQQQAFDLLKQIDESNLNTVIGMLEGALRIQEQIKSTKRN